MITYHQLRTFLAIVRTGSITKAARELSATQPTVSLQLHALEDFLGKPLLARDGNSMRLSPAGEQLRRYAEDVVGGLRILQQNIAALDGNVAGPLAVGVTFIVSRYVLPSALFRFREQFPDVNINLRVDFPGPLFQALSTNILDVACYLNVRTPPDLTIEQVGVEELLIVASPAHPLASRRRVTPRELADQPFVAPVSSTLREAIEAKLRDVGVTPRIAAEGSHHDAVKKLVERNVGYSALIRASVAEELASRRLVALRLDGPRILTEIVMAYRAATHASPLVQEFIRFVRADLARNRSAHPARDRARRPQGV
jgi:LysR family transcriptional regulator, low CO2-responsive transcriptional regulator